MNDSGDAVKFFIKKSSDPKYLIVIHDDLDLPIGRFKVSFNRGAAGHKGVVAIADRVKSNAFWRIRIGISPQGSTGAIKKVSGKKKVTKYVLGNFSKKEETILQKIYPEVATALLGILSGEEAGKAMPL